MSTRDAILDSARILVQQRGTNGMSYDDISRQVGIKKASIHYHFPSKADLLSELVTGYTESFFEAVEVEKESAPNGAGELDGFVDVFASTLEASDGTAVCLCGMMASELGCLDESAAEGVRRFYKLSIERLSVILEKGKEDGSLTLPPDLAVEGAADLIFSSLEGALLSARLEGGADRFRRLTKALTALFRG